MNEILGVVSREILSRIRCEFLEMPGLCLTHAQAQRLWGLDAQTCAGALATLADEQFLHLRHDGTYGQWSGCFEAFSPAPRNSPHPGAKYFRSAL